MELIVLEKANVFELAKIFNRYKDDFPRSEKKPFSIILINSFLRKKSDILALKKNGKIVSYAITLTDSKYDAVLIDYLATFKEYHSQGFGGMLIRHLAEFYKDKSGLIIEIEEIGKGDTQEENQIRERRRKFYLRNNFLLQNTKLNLFGVDMHMMFLPIKVDKFENFAEVAKDIYYRIFGKNLTDRKIKLTTDDIM